MKGEWLAALFNDPEIIVVCAVDDDRSNLDMFKAAGLVSIDSGDRVAAESLFENVMNWVGVQSKVVEKKTDKRKRLPAP